MLNVQPGQRPDNDAGYLEMMTFVIFMGGLNRQVVTNKWPGFIAGFLEFDVGKVAALTAEDVERLASDERVIRNAAKLKAVVGNAHAIQAIAAEHGSFGRWLRSLVDSQGPAAAASDIARRFKYVSDDSALRYLYAVGEDVGPVPEKIARKYGSAPH